MYAFEQIRVRDRILIEELLGRPDFEAGDLWNLIDNRATPLFQAEAIQLAAQSGVARFIPVVFAYLELEKVDNRVKRSGSQAAWLRA